MLEFVSSISVLLFLEAEFVILTVALRAKRRGDVIGARKVGLLGLPVMMIGIASSVITRHGTTAILRVAAGMAAVSGIVLLVDAARRWEDA